MKYSNKNTSCKDCCFATYDGITQIGCERNLLDKFRGVSANILECYDSDAEFFVIENRRCPSYRSKAWRLAAGDSIETQLGFENQLAFHAMIFLNNSIEEAKESILAMQDQTLTPTMLTIVRKKYNQIHPKEITSFINECTFPFEWRLENMLVEAKNENIIYNANRGRKIGFISSFQSGSTNQIEKTYFETINTFIIDQLRTFAMVSDDDSFTIPWSVYQYWKLNGDSDLSIIEQITQCQKDAKEQIIFKSQEIKKIIQEC